MSNRPYPKILRTTEAADATLRAYARKAHLAPFEALILAIGLLRTKDERDAASERAYKFAALWHAIARAIWRRWQNACHLHDRMRDERDRAADQRDATTRAADTLRADLESAREATRRADAEVEATRHANRILAGRADAAEAEVARLTREVASFRGGLDLAAETIARLTADLATAGEELEAERRRDEAAHDALRAEVERLDRELTISEENTAAAVRLVERREKELAGERLKTEAAQARRSSAAPCACALPDDFEAKLTARAPGWKGTLPELRARVIQLGFSRYDALKRAAKRAAERGR